MQEEEVDLAGVDPVRRAETLRRVQVVKRYLALARASKEDAISHAAELGLGRNQFLTLVRAWVEHKRASALPGATRRYRFLQEESRRRLDESVESVIDRAIHEVGLDRPINQIHGHAAELCAVAGLSPPNWSAIKPRVEAARRAVGNPALSDAVVLVGRCSLNVPVLTPERDVAPAVVAIAISARGGHVLSIDVGTAKHPGSVAKVIVEMAGRTDPHASPVQLRIAVAKSPERTALCRAFMIAGLDNNVSWIGRGQPLDTVQGALGGRLGGLTLTAPTKRSGWKLAAKLQTGLAAPIEESTLVEVVTEAIVAHNADEKRRGSAPPPVSFNDELTKPILIRALNGALS